MKKKKKGEEEEEMSHGLMDIDANLCNFRGINGTVNTSQAHLRLFRCMYTIAPIGLTPPIEKDNNKCIIKYQLHYFFLADNKLGR